MAIEIRELIIKASVSHGAAGAGTAAGADPSAGSNNNGVAPGDELVSACVERILEILKEKHER